jgi:hypothetical protein
VNPKTRGQQYHYPYERGTRGRENETIVTEIEMDISLESSSLKEIKHIDTVIKYTNCNLEVHGSKRGTYISYEVFSFSMKHT